MTDQTVIDVLINAMSAVLNCEGVAKRGAHAETEMARKHTPSYIGQDCSEFDGIRKAFKFAKAHGVDIEAAWMRGDCIDY